jgi:AGCS family alanine or glycine:cation symporter
VLGIPPLATGLLLLFLTAIAVFGGVKKIGRFTERLIPFMSALYLFLSLYAVLSHVSELPSALSRVFREAFSLSSGTAGAGGFLMTRAMRYGVTRGLLSNEAGAGTSAYAHAKSEKNDPVAEGILGMGEILFDTVILCMLTAFSILLSVEDVSLYKSGMELLSAAFSSVLGKAYRLPLLSSVFLFALSTAVCWYEYGRCALSCLGQKSGIAYLLIYSAFALFGAWLGSMALIPLCDAILFFLCAIALPTLIKSGTAVCALTEKALRIGKGDH